MIEIEDYKPDYKIILKGISPTDYEAYLDDKLIAKVIYEKEYADNGTSRNEYKIKLEDEVRRKIGSSTAYIDNPTSKTCMVNTIDNIGYHLTKYKEIKKKHIELKENFNKTNMLNQEELGYSLNYQENSDQIYLDDIKIASLNVIYDKTNSSQFEYILFKYETDVKYTHYKTLHSFNDLEKELHLLAQEKISVKEMPREECLVVEECTDCSNSYYHDKYKVHYCKDELKENENVR